MAEPQCFDPLQLCMLRVAKLGSGGAPATGANNGYRTDALVTAQIGLDVEDGSEHTKTNGCGDVAHYIKSADHVKGATLQLELTNYDFELLGMLIGNSQIFRDLAGAGSGEAIGWQAPAVAAAAGNGVCVEMWSKAWDGTQQATPAFAGGSTAVWFHWIFPKVLFRLSDFTLEEDFASITVEGIGSENGNLTINGPYDDWNADVAAAGGITNVFGVFFDASIPVTNCGRITVPSAS